MAHTQPTVSPRRRQKTLQEKWLVFNVVEHGDRHELVIRTADQAIHDHQVYTALEDSKTWGEFRRLLPEGEWGFLCNQLMSCAGWHERNDEQPELNWQDDEAPFDANVIPGFLLDYPRWAQQHIGKIIPPSVLKRHGTLTPAANRNQGAFWVIPVEKTHPLVNELRRRGYHVEGAQFLRGW